MKLRKLVLSSLMLAVLLVVCVVLISTGANAAGVDDLTFVLFDDAKSYYIHDCDETAAGALEIPASFNGKPVTKIGDSAFRDCTKLTSATIPNSVTYIGASAFEDCTSLTAVTIHGSITGIDEDAFRNCTSLTDITIPNSVTNIGLGAFMYCSSLTSVSIPDGVTAIGAWTFHGCTKLTSVTIPNSVKTIGSYAFEDCTSLSGVTIPNSVTTIGSLAFRGCTGLTDITVPNSVSHVAWATFSGCTSLTSVTIENGVLAIGDSAFTGCTSLKSITIPDSVTEIGVYAFEGCTDLYAMTIPNSVTYIGSGIFAECTGLTAVTVSNNVSSIPSYAFYGCSYLKSVSIPDSITSISASAFSGCANLTYNIFDSAKYLGNANNPYLVLVEAVSDDIAACTIHSKTKLILNRAFEGCISLTAITIPDGVASIPAYTFSGCTNLKDITIPDSITEIGDDAFSGCASLTYNIYDTAKYIGNAKNPYLVLVEVVSDDITACTIHSKTKIIYCRAFYGCVKLSSVTIPNSVTVIGNYAFRDCDGLSGLTIPDSVITIGERAFANCDILSSITIPDSVITIGDSAFWGCDNLINANIGKGIINIGANSFYGCDKLKSVTILGNAATIGYGAFWDCISLTTVTMPDTMVAIENHAFHNCASLTAIVIPQGITRITYMAFAGCESLATVTIPSSVTVIDELAFGGCGLTSVTIPEGVVTIVVSAFSSCKNLTSVTIPASVTSIGDAAFHYCDSLTGIWVDKNNAHYRSDSFGVLYNKDMTMLIQAPAAISGSFLIPDSVSTIEHYAFYCCKNLTGVIIPDSVTSIGYEAFFGCISLKSVTIPSSVTYIDDSVFSGCTGLIGIWVDINNLYYSNDSFGILYNKDKTKLIQVPGAISGACILPDTVTSIPSYAFRNCTGLTSVVISDGVTNIYTSTFSGCKNLTYVAISDSVDYIGSSAFDGCDNLQVIFYLGAMADWEDIDINSENAPLYNAELILNCAGFHETKGTYTVTSWGANIWSKPYTSGDSILVRTVNKGTNLSVVAKVTNSSGGSWYRLSDGNWIYSGNVVASYDPAAVESYNRSATVISGGGTNIWNKPYTVGDSKCIRTAAYNSKLTVVAKVVNSAGGLWYKLSDGNWVYSANIRVTDYNPADVVTYKKTFVVTSWGANIWSKPYSSGDSKVVKTVAKAANLSVVAKVRNSTYGLWYQLSDGGWVYSNNVIETSYEPSEVVAYNRSATVMATAGANIWSEPSTTGLSKLVRTGKYQAKLTVVGKVTNNAGSLWYKLSDGNWVYSGNIRVTDYNTADVETYKKTFTVTSWGANIWSKPYSSGDSKVVKTVAKAANLSIVAKVRNSTYGLWYQLSDGGWVYSNNVKEKTGVSYNTADVVTHKATYVVTAWSANVWSKPYSSGDSKLAKTVSKGTTLSVVAKVTNSSGGQWYKLSDGNWIYAANVTKK